MEVVFAPRWQGGLSVIQDLMSGGLIRHQEKQWRGTALTAPLIKNNHQLGKGKGVGRSVM